MFLLSSPCLLCSIRFPPLPPLSLSWPHYRLASLPYPAPSEPLTERLRGAPVSSAPTSLADVLPPADWGLCYADDKPELGQAAAAGNAGECNSFFFSAFRSPTNSLATPPVAAFHRLSPWFRCCDRRTVRFDPQLHGELSLPFIGVSLPFHSVFTAFR